MHNRNHWSSVRIHDTSSSDNRYVNDMMIINTENGSMPTSQEYDVYVCSSDTIIGTSISKCSGIKSVYSDLVFPGWPTRMTVVIERIVIVQLEHLQFSGALPLGVPSAFIKTSRVLAVIWNSVAVPVRCGMIRTKLGLIKHAEKLALPPGNR
jgi:hypothetical protein